MQVAARFALLSSQKNIGKLLGDWWMQKSLFPTLITTNMKRAVCSMYVEPLVSCLLQISKSLGGGAKHTISRGK